MTGVQTCALPISGLFAVLVWPREKSAADETAAAKSLGDVLRSFIPPTRGAGDFWKAFFGRFTMLISYQMINAYQLYIIQDYLGLSTEESGATVTVMSSITLVVGLVGGFLGGPLSDILKRRKVPVVMASLLFALGVLMPWIMPTTTGIYLFALIAGFGYAVYSSVDQELNNRIKELEENIMERNNRKVVLENFIKSLDYLDGEITEFSEELWVGLLDYIIIKDKSHCNSCLGVWLLWVTTSTSSPDFNSALNDTFLPLILPPTHLFPKIGRAHV